MLMGMPSPGLAKINKMNAEQLAERIKALQTESGHLDNKIKKLEAREPRDEAHIAMLNEQKARLTALMEHAQQRLSGKNERRDHRPSGGYRPRR